MNIKQAGQASGVSPQNIRYYEKAGLLTPTRNPQNDYREYTAQDVRTLKLIRALRMLDMPLEEVRRVLADELPLPRAAAAHQQRLEQRAEALQGAIRLCGELSAGGSSAAALDVDACLARMEAVQNEGDFFTRWREDYRRMACAESKKTFTFFPDDPVRTAREFSDALSAFAAQQGLELVILKEGMYPRFTINGVEYTARRTYMPVRGFPVASIHCEAAHPEQLEPALPPARRRAQRTLHYALPAVALLAFMLLVLGRSGNLRWMLASWQGWLLILSVAVLCVTSVYFTWLYTYNENGHWRRKK